MSRRARPTHFTHSATGKSWSSGNYGYASCTLRGIVRS